MGIALYQAGSTMPKKRDYRSVRFPAHRQPGGIGVPIQLVKYTRYIGWLEEHKTSGKPTKNIIIATQYQYDERLYCALKKLKDIEVYLYKVDFKLNEFKK
jgi:hypothetical protein